MELKIDYSGIPQPEVIQKSTYRKPRHVYFGKKDPDSGMMEEEPKYIHQEYPRMMYRKEGNVIKAFIVENDTDMTHALNSGAVRNTAEVGYLSAPSFEEVQAMKAGKSVSDAVAATAATTASTDPVTGAGEKKWRDMNAAERAEFQAKKAAA